MSVLQTMDNESFAIAIESTLPHLPNVPRTLSRFPNVSGSRCVFPVRCRRKQL